MHKAVILDLGRVVVDFDFKRGYLELEGLCPYPAAEIPKRLGSTDLVKRFETGLVGPEEFVSGLCQILQLRVGYERFCDIWSAIFREALLPEEMLEGLASRYRLILLSNTNSIHFDMIRRNYPLIRHFHELVLSYEVGAMKPSVEIYHAAVDRAGCRPEECFFTDDILEYVEAARRFGIDAEQFRSAEQLAKDLGKRGIEWQKNAGRH